ncbi:Os01g0797075 [Oryza sativa Japonica Group]|uniref:Os01g0797075 protein n=1 Tax=Oryza sativa subsp. japonica TaxID=39947 RepID=A0A0P0V997_ORYSJ|nr:Os01g0797075 [Oryza sativa Japonica Group]
MARRWGTGCGAGERRAWLPWRWGVASCAPHHRGRVDWWVWAAVLRQLRPLLPAHLHLVSPRQRHHRGSDPLAAAAGSGEEAAVTCPIYVKPFPSELAVSDHLVGCLVVAGGACPYAATYLAGDPLAFVMEVVKKLLGWAPHILF